MADIPKTRLLARKARHARVRRIVQGTSERPRLCVRRSLKNMYAQLIDDSSGKSLVQVTSLSKDIREARNGQKKVDLSREVGKLLAEKAKSQGIEKVVFDRGGYLYHGRIKAVADAAREAGLKF